MSNPNDFDELICRYIMKGTLRNTTQLHIGTGRSATEFATVDDPLIRLSIGMDEVPYIPGSSLKGILRTEIEKYLKGLGENICFPYDHKSSCNSGDIKDICLACQIFGCQQIGSHFVVSDAILLDTKDYPNPGTKIKPGIAINRVTGSTQRGALFQVETLQPGGVFNFEFQILNIDLKEDSIKKKAIKFALYQLKEGWIQVGGKRSTGLGQIKFNEKNGKLDVTVTEIRPEYLEDLKFAEKNLEDFLGEI